MYIANLPKWQAPAVHMTITADGTEIQPLSESATERSETKITSESDWNRIAQRERCHVHASL
jgi:hypothetical protein